MNRPLRKDETAQQGGEHYSGEWDWRCMALEGKDRKDESQYLS